MAQDPNISVPVGTSTSIKTITENQLHGVSFDAGGGGTQHIQVIAVGVHDGSGKTLDIVTQAQPLPVTFPTGASEAYDRIKELSDGLSLAPSTGVTAFRVKIDSSDPLTFTGEIAYAGITDNYDFRQMFVYGVPGATAINITGTADSGHVGVTGQVAIINGLSNLSIQGVSSSGFVGVTGHVATIGTGTGVPIRIGGTGGSGHVGVTGEVTVKGVATNAAIPVTGGVFVTGMGQGTTAMPVLATPPDGGGITSGITTGNLQTIRGFAAHGLSSGIRVLAKSVGSGGGTFCYVGHGPTVPGSTAAMYPLREFESVFIEIDNMNNVSVASDNTSVSISYIGS